MQADQFDYTAECRACGGTGQVDNYDGCPACNGRHDHGTDPEGTINRLHSAPDGEVRTYEELSPRGYVLIHTMPVRDENTGGLEGRYGTWSPADPTTGPMADYQPDMVDQLTNEPIGLRGPYEVYGREVSAANMPGGAWPDDADLNAEQVQAWVAQRGDTFMEKVAQNWVNEPNSPW